MLRSSPRLTVFGTTAIMIVGLWAALAVWANRERTLAIDSTSQVLDRLSSAVTEHVRGLFKLSEIVLNTGNQQLLADDGKNANELLVPLAEDLREKSSGLLDLLLIRSDGNVEFIPHRPDQPRAPFSDRDYMRAQASRTPEGLFFGTPIFGLLENEWALPMTMVPDRGPDGSTLIAVLRVERLAALHDQQRTKGHGAIGIIRTDGIMLSRAPFESRLMGFNVARLSDFDAVVLKHKRDTFITKSEELDRIPRIVSFIRIDDYPLIVFATAWLEQVLESSQERMHWMTASAAAVSVLALLAAFVLARSLEAISESRRRFMDFAETASDLVWESDPNQRFTFLSNRVQDVFGLEEDRIIGRSMENLGWEPANDTAKVQFQAAMLIQGSFNDIPFKRERGSPPVRIAAVSGRPYIVDGVFRGYRGVMTDITERVLQEEEHQRQAEREAQVGKMEALGQLAGGIAHDFNNLLGAILGFGQFLVQDTPADSPLRHYAERIVLAGQRGRGLVQQILAFSRRASGEPADIIMAGVVTDTVELLRATVPSSTTLIVENAGGDLAIRGDHSRISQVVLNLCVNASDALEHKDGEVRIAVRAFDGGHPAAGRLRSGEAATSSRPTVWQDEDGFDWACLGHLSGERYVVIQVSDTGSGIPRGNLSRLFDLFFSTKASSGGSGMGLAVVQRVVNESGGAIVVRTKIGHGSSFEVILPRADAAAPPPDHVSVNAGEPTRHRATILVVDDDVDFCAMLQTALQRAGHRVVAEHNPKDALGAVLVAPSLWDIVVTDQTMPGLKGSELVARVKAAAPSTRCIICTGYSSTLGEAEALAAGADAFRTKPVDVSEFTALVRRLLTTDEMV